MQPQEDISMRYPEQSAVMQKVLDMGSCGILCGHGIGTHLHEDPDIPNYKKLRRGIKLKSGYDACGGTYDQYRNTGCIVVR